MANRDINKRENIAAHMRLNMHINRIVRYLMCRCKRAATYQIEGANMIGECLCGAVAFEIVGHTSNLYQCHCSRCRKVSGSASNTALLVSNRQFKWLRGESEVTRYSQGRDFQSHFCRHCGSPLPNTLKGNNGYWVPAGLINDKINNRVSAHVFTGSKASWDTIPNDGVHFTDKPDMETLYKTIERTC